MAQITNFTVLIHFKLFASFQPITITTAFINKGLTHNKPWRMLNFIMMPRTSEGNVWFVVGYSYYNMTNYHPFASLSN